MRALRSNERTSFNALDVDECLVLLRWEVIGRLAVPVPDGAPLVVPVNFVLDGETIVFRTSEGHKLDYARDNPVSLEVDRFDWYRHTGWSVLVQGVARECAPEEVTHIEFETWAPGEMTHVVRITPTSITGRQLQLNVRATDARGYL
jgi:nitroimidazol reductase NimA-like FMN-containing flavoprotein (pyridoxamine 5'-phosphate oxidase superfamily)